MEIATSRPHRGRVRRRLAGAGVLLSLLLALAVGLPVVLGLQPTLVDGSAMAGTYDDGAVVYASSVGVHELRVGDVITFVPPPGWGVDGTVTRRIAAIREDGVIKTMGDASREADPWSFRPAGVTQTRVAFGIPWVGPVVGALSGPGTQLALVTAPLCLLALWGGVAAVAATRRTQHHPPGLVAVELPAPERVRVEVGS